MEEIGQRFRLGKWIVKPEKRAEFIEAWQISSDWLIQRLPDERGAVLLEDTNDPAGFVSYASVTDPDRANKLMLGTEFQALWAKVMQYCDDVQPHSMRVVASVTGRGVA